MSLIANDSESVGIQRVINKRELLIISIKELLIRELLIKLIIE